MKYDDEKICTLKNGSCVILRSPEAKDAEEIRRYLIRRAEETDFMLRDPDECESTEELAEELAQSIASPWELKIACIMDGRIVGLAEYHRLSLRKICHRADVSLGTLQTCWGLGIGTLLME